MKNYTIYNGIAVTDIDNRVPGILQQASLQAEDNLTAEQLDAMCYQEYMKRIEAEQVLLQE